jgi:hypothetical protein
MSTPDDYRAMAEECFRWARQAQTEDKRQAYLDVAPDVARSRVGPRLWPSSSDANPVAAQSEALMGAASISVLERGVRERFHPTRRYQLAHILVLHKSQRRDDRHLVRRQQTEQG